jgi:hypothetical protein
MKNERVYQIIFADLYPLYLSKIEKKGRTQGELDEVITWLTGYSLNELQQQIAGKTTLEKFFAFAPSFNPLANLISGTICGTHLQTMEEGLMKQIRQLDKLVDELAKGRAMAKILRTTKPIK